MGVREMERFLEQWQMDSRNLRRRMILSPTPRERERWYAMLLLAQGWTASSTAEALERDPHTIGRWAAAFGEGGPAALIFEQSGGSPALGETQQEALKGAVEQRPAAAGGQLVLEGSAAVCLRTVWHQPVPQQLPELSAPAGVCPEAPQEASDQC